MLAKSFESSVNSDLENQINTFITANQGAILVNGCKISFTTSPPKKLFATIYYSVSDVNQPLCKVLSSSSLVELDEKINSSGVNFSQDTISADYNGQMFVALLINLFIPD